MASDYETCRKNLEQLVDWYSTRASQRNEATTRLQLIDELFFSCLGWDKEDSILEEPYGRDYADYTFMAPRRILIVEAKKEGDYFEVPTEKDRLDYSLSALMRDYPHLKAAIEQATAGSDYAPNVTCDHSQTVPYQPFMPAIFLYRRYYGGYSGV